jgi:hypothetical protein
MYNIIIYLAPSPIHHSDSACDSSSRPTTPHDRSCSRERSGSNKKKTKKRTVFPCFGSLSRVKGRERARNTLISTIAVDVEKKKKKKKKSKKREIEDLEEDGIMMMVVETSPQIKFKNNNNHKKAGDDDLYITDSAFSTSDIIGVDGSLTRFRPRLKSKRSSSVPRTPSSLHRVKNSIHIVEPVVTRSHSRFTNNISIDITPSPCFYNGNEMCMFHYPSLSTAPCSASVNDECGVGDKIEMGRPSSLLSLSSIPLSSSPP